MRKSAGYRRVFNVTAGIAALALAVRGVTELREGHGWPLVGVAVMVVVALYLRNRIYRD